MEQAGNWQASPGTTSAATSTATSLDSVLVSPASAFDWTPDGVAPQALQAVVVEASPGVAAAELAADLAVVVAASAAASAGEGRSRSRSPSPCPAKPVRRSLVRRVSVSAPASPLLAHRGLPSLTPSASPTPLSSACASRSSTPPPLPSASSRQDLKVRFLELPKHSWEGRARQHAHAQAQAERQVGRRPRAEFDSGEEEDEDEEGDTSADATPSPSPLPLDQRPHHHHHHHHHHHGHHGLHGLGHGLELGRRRLSSFLHLQLHMPDHWPSVPAFKLSPPCSEDAESADNLSLGTPQYSGLRRFSFGLGLRRLSQAVRMWRCVACSDALLTARHWTRTYNLWINFLPGRGTEAFAVFIT